MKRLFNPNSLTFFLIGEPSLSVTSDTIELHGLNFQTKNYCQLKAKFNFECFFVTVADGSLGSRRNLPSSHRNPWNARQANDRTQRHQDQEHLGEKGPDLRHR